MQGNEPRLTDMLTQGGSRVLRITTLEQPVSFATPRPASEQREQTGRNVKLEPNTNGHQSEMIFILLK